MGLKGMLIDYENCTGCHACEMACRQEYGYDIEKCGLVINQIGPNKLSGDRWEYDFVPAPTARCMLCTSRVNKGKLPTCVQHCQSFCIDVGDLDELYEKIDSPKQVLYAIR